MQNIIDEINRLKIEKDAFIIAHLYQSAEIQAIADYVGDSFELAKKAREVQNKIIVFCGVHFMAESAKILNPDKKVLLPVLTAGCPMADMVSAEDVIELKKQYPEAAVVCYVNTSAAVKAECDVCCTSSNAVKIVNALPQKQILFVPDENLGSFVADKIKHKEIILFKGYCIVHKRVLENELTAARAAHPNVKILVHPECTPEVVKSADFAGSTAQILEYVRTSDEKEFIIGTEQGILYPLQKQNPHKKFYVLSSKLICANMKKTHLEDLLKCLQNEEFEITLSDETIKRAEKSLNRMMEIVMHNS
jgi:quinolinate synthase